jgi:signal transduction histidine kinase
VLSSALADNSFLVVTAIPSRPADFIRETLSVFKAEMLSKDIRCELEVKPSFATLDVDYLLTDPSRVNQLLINLLTNAISECLPSQSRVMVSYWPTEFTAPGSDRHIRVILDVAARRPVLPGSASSSQVDPQANASPTSTPSEDPDTVFLSVSVCDTGRGLTSEEAAGLFKRFKQASAMTHISYGGSGLGLFICKRLAELLGGDIGIQSELGKGSTFTFYVPTKRCAKPQESASTAAQSTASAAATTSTPAEDVSLQGLHVLVSYIPCPC